MVNQTYSCISHPYTVERTSCADSSVCSHTHQALRGKETYGVFCIHFGFKIASLLLWFPSMALSKDSNELETPCLLWHSAHTHASISHGLMFLYEFDKHICYAFLISLSLCPCSPCSSPWLYFTQIWCWLSNPTCILSQQAKFRRYPTMVTVTGTASGV